MRVLQVVPGISPRAGGPSHTMSFVRSLAKHGVEATLVTTNADAGDRLAVSLHQPVVRDGVTCIFHNVLSVGGRWGVAPSFMRTLRRIVGTYDLVHIHWLFDFSSIAAARAAIAAGVPFLIQPHGSLDPHLGRKNRLAKRLYLATIGRPLLSRAAAVVFTSEQERRLASYGPSRPEWIVPVGLDMDQYATLPERGAFRAAFPSVAGGFLLFLGRLSPQKGLDLLLPAFHRVLKIRPELSLVLMGPDYRGYEAEVRRMARDLGIEQRILITGLLPHQLKLAAFVDAELFVLPSYAENFGVVVPEALACGLPVVISDQVGIHQELAAEGAATVVRCDVDSVSAGIESALSDRALRERMATLGPAMVRTHYTWDAIMPMVIKRYSDVIAARNRGRW